MYSETPPLRRKRIARHGQTSQRMHRASAYSDDGYPPPPPPRSRPRPRPPARSYDYERGAGDDYYGERDYYYDYDDYPPPRRAARRGRPRPPRRPAPVYYYGDERYDRPPPKSDYDYDDDYDYDRPRKKRVGSSPKKSPSSGGGGSRAVVAIAVIFIILIILLMFWPAIQPALQDLSENPPSLRYQEFPEGLDFTVSKEMTLQASGSNRDSISYTLKSACPKDYVMGEFYLQDVKDVRVNPIPNTGDPDFNNRSQEIMLWQEDNFLGTRDFVATYTIRTRFYQWEMTEEDSLLIADIPNGLKTKYNHDEWPVDQDRDGEFDPEDDLDNDGDLDYLIEVTNPRIQRLAKDLQKGSNNVYTVVKNIYDYLVKDENLNYVPSAQGLPKDCITTLNQLQGDCDDYSILFISLCRAVDIPAWLELGVLYDRQQRQWGGHGWAKVAIPFEGGWTAATIDVVNKQFLFHDPYRFIEWIDTGGDVTYYEEGELKIVNNLDYYYHSFSYRSYGSPRIVSPDTNNFNTEQMSEFGDTHKIPVEGDPGSELCMIPGFEAWLSIMTIVTITLVVAAASAERKR
ncbi:transglutaminase-like domain-containing protein [[Eubacterium] cellulosolvens]